jgi:hypothetical protein
VAAGRLLQEMVAGHSSCRSRGATCCTSS